MWLPNLKRLCTSSQPSTSLGKKKLVHRNWSIKKKHRTIPEEAAKPLWTFWSPKNAARQPLWLKTRCFENIFRSQICSKIKRTKKCMSCNLREQASFSGSFERSFDGDRSVYPLKLCLESRLETIFVWNNCAFPLQT